MRNLMLMTLFLVCVSAEAKAQTNLVPAGTLLRCTMDEPNFSPRTAEIGDPVLCHLNGVTMFGRPAFPRGSYLGGHLEAAKQPGHFVGKGYMKIVFDRIGLPNTDEQFDAKIVEARGQHVDKQGDIVGHGHARRDVVEWMIPPLWPWKVITLPARGPQPKLKSEQQITLRLMQDIEVPQLAKYSPRPSLWHNFGGANPGAGLSRQAYVQPQPTGTADLSHQDAIVPHSYPRVYYTNPGMPAEETRVSQPLAQAGFTDRPAADSSVIQSSANAAQTGFSLKQSSNVPARRITLLALRADTMLYDMTDYWVVDRRLYFLRPDGSEASTDLNNVDWQLTSDLNAERNVRLTLRTKSTSY